MKYFTVDELRMLLRSTPPEKPWQRLMFLVMYWHGCRVGEVTKLRGRDIQHGYLNFNRLKGSVPCSQPHIKHRDPELDEAGPLGELAAKYKQDELLFPISPRGVQKLMERISVRTGLNWEKMHPHTLKHTTAMHAIQNGNTIDKVRAILGHRSLSSTGFYLTPNQDDAVNDFARSMGA